MNEELKFYIKNWLFRAQEDLAVVKSLSELNIEHFTSSICFHCQQATEKYLKAYLVYSGINFPKTHDVDYLISKCIELISEKFSDFDLRNLSEFGVDIRYPDDFYLPDVDETLYYISLSESISKVVLNLIVL